mgnify:CR=1 FL=1
MNRKEFVLIIIFKFFRFLISAPPPPLTQILINIPMEGVLPKNEVIDRIIL